MTSQQKSLAVDATRRWIGEMVVGLNLCPFARRVFHGNLIRYTVTDAADAESLRTELANELDILNQTPETEIETTLLIHPRALGHFTDYCDFLPVAQSLVRTQGLRGVIQIASFHPEFQFQDAEPAAVENYTNRSPFPMLHLLREASVSRAADAHPEEVVQIPKRNIATLRALGLEKVLELQTRPFGSSPGGSISGGSTHAV